MDGTLEKRDNVDEDVEHFEVDGIDDKLNESDRGKRQVRHGRYYVKNVPKAVKFFDFTQYNNNLHNIRQNLRNVPAYNSISFPDSSPKSTYSDNIFTTPNPFLHFSTNTNSLHYHTPESYNKPFKASSPDPYSLRPPHNPINTATHIITKSPPISSLNNNENPFSALAGGFLNNIPQKTGSHGEVNNFLIHNPYDSSLGSSSVVTDRPVLISTSPRGKLNNKLPLKTNNINDYNMQNNKNQSKYPKVTSDSNESNDYDEKEDEEKNEEDSNSSEEDDEEDNSSDYFHKHAYNFPKPPYEFRHPSNKYAEINNPFEDPNFDFDDFLSKLRDEPVSVTASSTRKPNQLQNAAYHDETIDDDKAIIKKTKSTTLSYKGMSTPRPFTLPSNINSWPVHSTSDEIVNTKKINISNSQTVANNNIQQDKQQQHAHMQQQILKAFNNAPQLGAVSHLGPFRPQLKPPNFKDDRQLPLSHNFNGNLVYNPSSQRPKLVVSTVAPKHYLFVTGKNQPILFTTPKPNYSVSQNQAIVTGMPYLLSSFKPNNVNNNNIYKQQTSNPILFNQQTPTKSQAYRIQPLEAQKPRQNQVSEIPSLESIFSQTHKPTSQSSTTTRRTPLQSVTTEVSTTTILPKRRPIPKPSPEMGDYYYDDDEEQYYYEPVVKPKYMPSSEVRPQRPLIAQNYEEYEDDHFEEPASSRKPQNVSIRIQGNKIESATKNHNDVSVVTKSPYKGLIKNNHNGKIPVPVMMNYVTPAPTVLMRPEISNYNIDHHYRNRTAVRMRRPVKRPINSGPNTIRPPKYLNQTTLRPYTVRHRLAKPTTMQTPVVPNSENKQGQRGRTRRPSTFTQVKSTTPRDNHNQETRYSKTKHDDRTNR